MNIIAGSVVLGLLLHRWLPLAIADGKRSQQRNDKLKALAALDSLTGLYNRRQFEAAFRAELARTIASTKRDSDIAARVGGEEFVILLPETGKEAAGAFAERLCELVRENSLDVAGGPLRLTVSIGVAEATIRTAGIETLMREADQALYDAKRAGRDRVAIAASASQRLAEAAE